MFVTKPLSESEPDLLLGSEHEDLLIKIDCHEKPMRVIAPTQGWTHESLEVIYSIYAAPLTEVWNAYLGDMVKDQWIGSSEI